MKGDFHTRFYKEPITPRLKERISKDKEYYSSLGWCNNEGVINELQYVTDQFGYRNEFTPTANTPIALGCSDTYGIGTFKHHMWTTVLSNLIGKDIYNCGVPGGSVKTCFRVLKSVIEDLGVIPSTIFMLTPRKYRTEFMVTDSKNEYRMQVGPNFHEVLVDEMEQFKPLCKELFEKIYSIEENINIESEAYMLAIQQMCSINKIPIYFLDNYDSFTVFMKKNKKVLKAYDCGHLGPDYQAEVAQKFFEKYMLKKL